MQVHGFLARHRRPALGEDRDSTGACATRGGVVVAAAADEGFPAGPSGGTLADPALAFAQEQAPAAAGTDARTRRMHGPAPCNPAA